MVLRRQAWGLAFRRRVEVEDNGQFLLIHLFTLRLDYNFRRTTPSNLCWRKSLGNYGHVLEYILRRTSGTDQAFEPLISFLSMSLSMLFLLFSGTMGLSGGNSIAFQQSLATCQALLPIASVTIYLCHIQDGLHNIKSVGSQGNVSDQSFCERPRLLWEMTTKRHHCANV